MSTSTTNAKAGKYRGGVKDKVRSVVPAAVMVPNAEFVRRDKFSRLSFKLSEQLYEELTARSEALCPEAVTIPVMYDDFKNARVIRGKVIKESGIEVPDKEDQMPVIHEEGEDDHTMEAGGTYKVKGALKVARLGMPPQPCVYFAITSIDPLEPPPPALEREPTSTPKRKTKAKPEPVKVGKAKAKPAPAVEVEDEDGGDSDGPD